MLVFSPEECAEIVQEFDGAKNKKDENGEMFYRNSHGVGDLSSTHKHVERITREIHKRYPGAVFSNTYTRVYRKGSYLKLHTDRAGLDVTLSVCLEKKTPISWPLHVSSGLYDDTKEWDINTDPAKYTDKYASYDMAEGVGAICEGRKHPHWRDTFECGDDERAVYVFYHWTMPKKIEIATPTKAVNRVFKPSVKIALPDAAVYENFLSEAECALMIWMARDRLERSTVVNNDDGSSYVDNNRTSMGMSFRIGENSVIERIEQRISALTGHPVENGEGIQILRYQVGQEYKPHHDYFDPNWSGLVKESLNNRICTFLMYLNTPKGGGATVFPDVNIEVAAKQGSALMFSYPTPTIDTKTLHGGAPVTEGEKWIATKWIRRNKY